MYALTRPCTVARVAPAHARRARRVSPVVRAEPELKEEITAAIKEAEEICEGDNKGECAAAWDSVEELSAAASHKEAARNEQKENDPLEAYCREVPDADECRVYED